MIWWQAERGEEKNRMHKRKKKCLKRILPLLLAAVLLAEGTCASVYAAEEGMPVDEFVEEEAPTVDEAGDPDREEDDGMQSVVEEGGETDTSSEQQTVSEDTVPEDTASEDTVSENTVSENTAEDENPEEWDGEDALGKAPLGKDDMGKNAVFSDNGLSTLAETGQKLKRGTPSVTDIIDRYKAYPWKLDVKNSYSEQPSAKSPYKAGYLKDECLDNALNLLNFIRYVAGVPADVELSGDYTEMAQAGALLNCVNGKLTDDPPAKPEGFPDDLYNLGSVAYSNCSIAKGYGNLSKVLMNGWMYDGASADMEKMSHRRYILNPSMTRTGFGAAGAYSFMYALDRKGSSITDYVAWPARNMPVELMNNPGTPWTLSLGSDYDKASFQEVSVTLRDISKNKSWTFSGTNANGVFKVNVEYYGMPNCIVFRPNNVSYDKNSQFQVEVNGLKDKDGKSTTISYNVDFFSLNDEPAEVTGVKLNKEELHLLKGVEGKQEETLLATVTPSNAADKSLTWKSTDETVARVDGNGRVTAVGVGTTEISVKAANGLQAVCTVKVSDYSLQSDAEGFSFDAEAKEYGLSFDLTMNARPGQLVVMDGDPTKEENAADDRINWISENESVAEVGSDGTVTPRAVGETVIWADVDNGLAVLACEVTVEDSKLPRIEMREQECTLNIRKDAAGNLKADSRQLRLYFTPADSKWVNQGQTCVKWTSDNPAAAAFATKQADGARSTEAETISGSTVTVTAVGAGQAKISAVIVDAEGNPVTESDGKKAEASCTVKVQAEAEPAADDIPRPVVLTNTQTTLEEVALPAGWSWKEPDTPLTQFTGTKAKKFTALYQPEGTDGNALPAERLLEVSFLTVESLSAGLRTEEGKEKGDAVLIVGQKVESYVNYSFDKALEQLENNADYKNNAWYNKQKEAILREIGEKTIWSSSNPSVISVEPAADKGALTAENAGSAKLVAKSAGSVTVRASLKLGRKTFNASVKLTVKETDGTLTVKSVENFARAGESGSGAGQTAEKYTGLLSTFQTDKPNQANCKMTLTLPGATKITAKSGNAKVVAVKSSAAEGDGFAVSLIVRAAGTAEITLTGNDAVKTSRTIRLVVGDAEPGLSDESVTVNVLQTVGAEISLYPAKSPEGTVYGITDVTMAADEKSRNFTLTTGKAAGCYAIRAKSGTKAGTYKVKISAEAGGTSYDLPLTVKVVSKNPAYKVKQERKLNLFYKNDESLLHIDTGETIKNLQCTGLADYSIVKKDGCYYIKSEEGATVKSVKKGKLQISFEGWQGTYTTSLTVGVEKKAPRITWDTNRVTLYPKMGIQSLWIGTGNTGAISWESVHVEKNSGKAKGNYTVEVDREKGRLLLSGKNLNQADSFKLQILLSDPEKWAEKETVNYTLQVKVSMGTPAIVLTSKTLQLNADAAFRGYDAASTTVKWRDGGQLTADQGIRVSVYCDPKDAKAKNLVNGGQVIFSVTKENGSYQVAARLNNKDVDPGTYKYIVQASKNGQIWKTPLALKVVNAAPEKAVKMAVKGSIDVLNRDGSFMTLTPSLNAVSGVFVIPENREVKLTGRDAHLFQADWSEDGRTIELRAKREETLVTKYQYTVTPVLTLRNVIGETEEVQAPAVKFKLKQGSVKVSALPKTVLMYSGAYNSVEVDMDALLKGADAPEIESVTLVGNTDAFAYEYIKDGKGTLTMKDTGRAVKGKNYSLQFRVSFAEQADNVKPVTVRCTVKVK